MRRSQATLTHRSKDKLMRIATYVGYFRKNEARWAYLVQNTENHKKTSISQKKVPLGRFFVRRSQQ